MEGTALLIFEMTQRNYMVFHTFRLDFYAVKVIFIFKSSNNRTL